MSLRKIPKRKKRPKTIDKSHPNSLEQKIKEVHILFNNDYFNQGYSKLNELSVKYPKNHQLKIYWVISYLNKYIGHQKKSASKKAFNQMNRDLLDYYENYLISIKDTAKLRDESIQYITLMGKVGFQTMDKVKIKEVDFAIHRLFYYYLDAILNTDYLAIIRYLEDLQNEIKSGFLQTPKSQMIQEFYKGIYYFLIQKFNKSEESFFQIFLIFSRKDGDINEIGTDLFLSYIELRFEKIGLDAFMFLLIIHILKKRDKNDLNKLKSIKEKISPIFGNGPYHSFKQNLQNSFLNCIIPFLKESEKENKNIKFNIENLEKIIIPYYLQRVEKGRRLKWN